jgi:hypothetical protein
MTKPYRVHPKYYSPLGLVTTVTEAAETWKRHRSVILYAIDAENIAAVKSGATWLISVPSLQAFWGDPPALSKPFIGSFQSGAPLQIAGKGGRNDERGGHQKQ